jgi:two-component system, chemotaxis family, sensor kinase CheA
MADKDFLDLSIFLNDFWSDSQEDFQAANRALLALEKDPSQHERLNEVFRAVHTLKSSSTMLEFNQVAELAHLVEDLLDQIRGGDLPLNQSAIDVLLEGIDSLETLVTERVAGMSEAEQSATATVRTEELRHKANGLAYQELLVRQGVIAIDEGGLIESFNPAAERMFGYAAAEANGQKLSLLMPEPYKSEQENYLSNYLQTGKAKIIGTGRELVGRRKDGSTFPLELAVSEIRPRGVRLFIGIVREISRRKVKFASAHTIEKTRTIRVQAELLDSLFNLVGELIITRNRIATIVSGLAGKELKGALATMDRLVNDLQEDVSAARLVPVDEIFQKFPRMVRDLALEEHKEIDLVLEGRQIELDKAVLDTIGDPVTHLLRNAVGHGIELPEERLRRQKLRRGTIRLAAKRQENEVRIEVSDDGAGMDVAELRDTAVRKGILRPEEAEALQRDEVLALVFRPAFSSAREVTSLSGRGVGLDVVKTAAERLGGTVEVATEPGRGSQFTLRLPLATAIIQTLMVSVGGQVFAIPSDVVLETVDVKSGEIKAIGSEKALVIRGEIVPFIALRDLLGIAPGENPENQFVVVIHRGEKLVGIGVDTVLDQMENIIKPLDPVAQQVRAFSGGTILGDGRLALLLDLFALL